MLAVVMMVPVMSSYGADRLKLKSETLAVTVDKAFPRIIRYQHKNGAAFAGQKEPVSTVHFNGKPEPCTIKLTRAGRSSAEYQLQFPGKKVTVSVKIEVGETAVEMGMTGVKEQGDVKLMNLSFPGNVLLTVDSSLPDAEVVAYGTWTTTGTRRHKTAGVVRVTANHHVHAKLADAKPSTHKLNYFFISGGKLAAATWGNHYESHNRTQYSITKEDNRTVCKAWCPEWAWREVESEAVDLPWTRIFITPDCNGDGKATWQDAAVVCRRGVPKPFGHEHMKTQVGQCIALNFASGAQQPYLKILDNIKKIHRATDGLGNDVLIKGFSSEGHDSANTDFSGHFNERAGGVDDFNVLLNNAGKYNAMVGIHANITEVYPEAHQYDPEILFRDSRGNLRRRWVWLDTSWEIDRKKYILNGSLFTSMERMEKEIPGLDYVYLDKAHPDDWESYKIFKKLNDLGLPAHSEANDITYTVQSHWRGGNKQPCLQFLWYSERDIFGNDWILRGGRSDGEGFMGWRSHNFNSYIGSTFAHHLPAKYLKNFELLRWEPGRLAHFSDGVKVTKAANGWIEVTKDGRMVMTWAGRNTSLFVPWEPKKEKKIYVWDSTGKPREWALPKSWDSCKQVYLYKLSDQGRTDEKVLDIKDGKLAITPIRHTPYVVYKTKAPKPLDYDWGQGSVVKDPNFDSYGFTYWRKSSGNSDTSHISISNDRNRNAYLTIHAKNREASEVSQIMSGLKPGKTYVAAVWVHVSGNRTAIIEILPQGKKGIKPISNYVSKTNVRHGLAFDQRTGSNWQYMKVYFDMPAGCSKARICLKATKTESSGAVYFDDVRVVERKRSAKASKHFVWEDFEDTALGGYGILTCNFGQHTHLSESHPPYTKDTINGRFSFKSRDGGRVGRTLPCNVRFKPSTRYRLSMETLAGPGRIRVMSEGKAVFDKSFNGRGTVAGEFVTGNDTESYLEVHRTGGPYIVVDDIAVDEMGPASK